jgi:RNA polymerase sigma-70 factor, ECF subfamily
MAAATASMSNPPHDLPVTPTSPSSSGSDPDPAPDHAAAPDHEAALPTDPLDRLTPAVRRRDRDAIAEVYLTVAPGLRGYLRRRVGHGEIADDLVEQTFVELIEGCDRFRGDGRALRAWLYRAARNNLYDWRKRADRRSDHELRRRHTATMEADGGDEPSRRFDEATLDPALEAALRELTEDQREVLELRLVAGLPFAEVARLTGRSESAVKLVQHRALRRLAALLAGASALDEDRPESGTP